MLILALLLLQDDPAFRRADATVNQLARGARLYTAHHGKLPASIDALLTGGFLPMETPPKDPWGGTIGFAVDGDALEIKFERGARKLSVIVSKNQVNPRTIQPGDRLAEMAMGAVQEYRTLHGKPPENLAALAAEPAVLFDPKKAPGMKMRTASYAVALSIPAAAIDPLSPAARESLVSHLRDLASEDSAVRDHASQAIREMGPAALEPIRAARRTAKDPEVAARLHELDGSLAADKKRLERAREIVVSAKKDEDTASNERDASTYLKFVVTAQESFLANDLDRNAINDYWTGDIAGLYCLEVIATGNAIAALNDIGVARSDAAPLKEKFENDLVMYKAALLEIEQGIPMPKNGYLFRAMVEDAQGNAYATDTGDGPVVHNFGCFGFVAYPAVYGVTGRQTFIINQEAGVLSRDTGGEPVLKYPNAAEISVHWAKVE